MSVQVKIPQVSVTHHESKIIRWFKKEGDNVSAGEPLLEIETEKVTVEIQAQISGVVSAILAPEGSSVPVLGNVAEIAPLHKQQGESKT